MKDVMSRWGTQMELDDLKGICGIYAIVREDGLKGYIGSSYDIHDRIRTHNSVCNRLTKKAPNKNLMKDWDHYSFFYTVLKECEETELLKQEHYYTTSFDDELLYNIQRWVNHNSNYKELWNKIKTKITVEENGCWHPHCGESQGYQKIYEGKIQHLIHRISYIVHNDDFPFLVGHLCNTKWCCNPDHLKHKSMGENARHSYKYEDNKYYPYVDDIIHKITKLGYTETMVFEELNIDIDFANFNKYVRKIMKVHGLKKPAHSGRKTYILMQNKDLITKMRTVECKSYKDIANSLPFDVSSVFIREFCKRFQIKAKYNNMSKLKRMIITRDLLDDVIDLRRQNKSYKFIVNHLNLGIHVESVRRFCVQEGIIKGTGESLQVSEH